MKQLKKKKKVENELLFYIQASNEGCRANQNCHSNVIADDFGRHNPPTPTMPMTVGIVCHR